MANAARQPISISEPVAQSHATLAPPWYPEQYPNATLLGLPAELRLLIYGLFSDSKMVHVQSPRASAYTWIPCKGKRYSLAPAAPLGFWGLAATAKSVRAEMQDLFLEECVFSIQPSDVVGWLR
ncbi:hypothetical protein HBI56_102020 [Parastagonospora nodorum]|uniref:F-box domain-containing protein n=1 Tax=Phaeosphaeria nodorum (strain SN15 / ATCC MYA-4574 / FGSC 10173) TaxID=321614 RepID=A0A7U2F5X4_PHANO|nr:hypothetical protein HBH56_030980 [Parastagonospora nodorum]QRC99323.1 hypothetical protein JI435_304770 [Parastagonospora nodorum SN15]KAH3934617.1 hypothetical protein HBH54_051030 [Parastagonospora nodorum]KAH3943053.1 hypothetical protein HBH53_179640 [Parastagonospora nodorum]KAH3956606.1 hypothetical protein HBH51_238380 [Parastagonospora nodorum]